MLFFSYSEYYFHKNMRHMLLFAKGGRKDFFFILFFLPKSVVIPAFEKIAYFDASYILSTILILGNFIRNSFLFNKEEHWSIIKFKSNLRFTTWKIFNAFNTFKVFYILCYFVCCPLKNFQLMKYVSNLALYSTDKINRWTRYL